MHSERFDPSQCDLLESAIARRYEVPWETLENDEDGGCIHVPELGLLLVRVHMEVWSHTAITVTTPHVARIVGLHVPQGNSDAEVRIGCSPQYEKLVPGYYDCDHGLCSRMVPLFVEVAPHGANAIDFVFVAERHVHPGLRAYKHEYVRGLAEVIAQQPEIVPHAEVLLAHIDSDLEQLEQVRRVIRVGKR